MQADTGGLASPFYVSASTFNELTMAGQIPRLVACLESRPDKIWAIPLRTKGRNTDESAGRILESSAGEGQPRFSPDGRLLAFSSNRSGSSEIWLADADGQNARQLTHMSFYIAGHPHWSSNGKWLAFHARAPREPQIYVVRVADGLIKQVTHSIPGFMGPSWSMDGQTLYADSFERGKNQTYTIPVAGGIPQFLFEASDAVEAPSRKLLIYNKQDQSGIYARFLVGDVAKNPEHLLIADYQTPWGGFDPVSDGIYYVGQSSLGLPRAFRFYSFTTGRSVDVAPAPTNLDIGITVTSDRTRLLYCTKSGGSDLVQVELQMTPVG